MKCKECKHWERDEESQFGDCKLLKTDDGAYDEKQLAHCLDVEGYCATLKCKGEFGCVLFK